MVMRIFGVLFYLVMALAASYLLTNDVKINKTITITGYPDGIYTLTNENREKIDKFLLEFEKDKKWLVSSYVFTVTGYATKKGPLTKNIKLSGWRAENVFEYIKGKYRIEPGKLPAGDGDEKKVVIDYQIQGKPLNIISLMFFLFLSPLIVWLFLSFVKKYKKSARVSIEEAETPLVEKEEEEFWPVKNLDLVEVLLDESNEGKPGKKCPYCSDPISWEHLVRHLGKKKCKESPYKAGNNTKKKFVDYLRMLSLHSFDEHGGA